MKQIKNYKKVGVFKKLLIKLSRLGGYELIDQANFSTPDNFKQDVNNLSLPGKKSITIPMGEVKIKRPVESLDVIVKTCTSVNLVTQNKKRIFEKDKFEYTLRSVFSLTKNLKKLREVFEKIKIKITIIDFNSKKEDLNKIEQILKTSGLNFEIINLNLNDYPDIKTLNKNNETIESNMKSTMASILKSFDYAKENCDDLIYFVEDDYIHKNDCILEMIFSYEKFATIFNEDLFLLPVDYPYLYQKNEVSSILLGNKSHWRSVKESLLTFMTSKKILNKHLNELTNMAKNESEPFEQNLHKIYKQEICLSPVPSLAIHCTNVNSIFGLSPNINYKKIWDENKPD